MSGTATWNHQLPMYTCASFYGARYQQPDLDLADHHQHHQHHHHQHQHHFLAPLIIDLSYDVTDNKTSDLHFKSPFITMNDVFHREDERLKTFENWPLSWLDKKQLAQTGMFYTGDDDKVKCYFCEVEIGRWEREDQPVPEHLRWSPNCPLLRRRTTNNVPIDNEELNQILPPLSYDICGANDAIEVRNNSEASSGAQLQQQQQTATTTTTTTARQLNCSSTAGVVSNLNNATTYYPEYPEYAIEAARVRSFSEWPRHMKQTPIQMAEAGFFHSGIGDRVKCFSCGGGLKDWDDSDEPWEQHALWLPKCRFLKLMKGESFIDAVIAKHKQANDNHADLLLNNNAKEEKPSCSVQTTPMTVMTALTQTQQQQQQIGESVTTTPATTTQAADLLNETLAEATTPADVEFSENVATSSSTATATACTTTTPTALFCDTLKVCSATAARCSSSNSNSNSNNSANNIPEEKLCKICYANEYNTAFLPCGHVVACAKCASSVTKCPMCRKPFTDVMRVYFS